MTTTGIYFPDDEPFFIIVYNINKKHSYMCMFDINGRDYVGFDTNNNIKKILQETYDIENTKNDDYYIDITDEKFIEICKEKYGYAIHDSVISITESKKCTYESLFNNIKKTDFINNVSKEEEEEAAEKELELMLNTPKKLRTINERIKIENEIKNLFNKNRTMLLNLKNKPLDENALLAQYKMFINNNEEN